MRKAEFCPIEPEILWDTSRRLLAIHVWSSRNILVIYIEREREMYSHQHIMGTEVSGVSNNAYRICGVRIGIITESWKSSTFKNRGEEFTKESKQLKTKGIHCLFKCWEFIVCSMGDLLNNTEVLNSKIYLTLQILKTSLYPFTKHFPMETAFTFHKFHLITFRFCMSIKCIRFTNYTKKTTQGTHLAD